MIKKLTIALGFLLLPVWVFAYANPGQPAGLVNDYARLLTEAQQLTLENKLSDFEKQSSNEIAIVTITDLGGDTIENFAQQLFKDWGIGKKNKDNGVLILVAVADRQMRIEVGYGLEGALTDAQSFWIINNVLRPAFQQENYYDGLAGAADKIIAATKGEYIPSDTSAKPSQDFNQWIKQGEFWIWMLILFFVYGGSLLARSRSWWAGGIVGGVIAFIFTVVGGFLLIKLLSFVILVPLGLLFDFLVSRAYTRGQERGSIPWWIGGNRWGSGGSSWGGGGFGGFGGGGSGGGGSSGGW